MRRLAIVAAHFVPSNLAAVHRSRLWSLHLREFGWEPIIVTTAPEFYEEKSDPDLVELLPPDLHVIRTSALRTKPIRWVGDIGIRGFYGHYRALLNLAGRKKIDFLHITIPSNYSALLGRMVKRRTGLPYGIDYIDPWVHQFPGSDRVFSKAWASARLANLLEPWAVKHASLITGINRAYFQGMLDRNPAVAKQAVLAAMPYGGSENDHAVVRRLARPAYLFRDHAQNFNLIYAGAMLPRAYGVLNCFLEGLALLKARRPALSQSFHLHFVGTGKSPDDALGYNIKPYIERFSVSDCATEHPQRISYLDVLTHLHAASGVLVLGSSEPHYSPSKIFQSVMSRRPVFALLHRDSTAVGVLKEANAGRLVTLTGSELPAAGALADALEAFIFGGGYSADRVNWASLEQYSARTSARLLATALEEVMRTERSPARRT